MSYLSHLLLRARPPALCFPAVVWRFLKPRVAGWARHRNDWHVAAELTFALPSTDQLHQLLGRKVLAEAKVRQLSRLQETERQLAEAIVAALNGQERVLREFEDSMALFRRLQASLRNESGVSVEELEERLADVNDALVATGDMRELYAEPSDRFEETLQQQGLELCDREEPPLHLAERRCPQPALPEVARVDDVLPEEADEGRVAQKLVLGVLVDGEDEV